MTFRYLPIWQLHRSIRRMINAEDRPYTINDLMVLHNLSRTTVIRLYENEPDVMVLQASREHQRKIGRRYRTIRVPVKVYRRVRERMSL